MAFHTNNKTAAQHLKKKFKKKKRKSVFTPPPASARLHCWASDFGLRASRASKLQSVVVKPSGLSALNERLELQLPFILFNLIQRNIEKVTKIVKKKKIWRKDTSENDKQLVL